MLRLRPGTATHTQEKKPSKTKQILGDQRLKQELYNFKIFRRKYWRIQSCFRVRRISSDKNAKDK